MFSLKEYVAQIDEFVKVNKGMSFASYPNSILTRRRRRLLFVT
jgi:hypothetical protein